MFAGVQDAPEQNVPTLVLSENHRWLLKYYDSRVVALFATSTLEFQRKFKASQSSSVQITHYSFSFDSAQALIGTSDGKAKVFSIETGALLHDLSLVAGPVSAMAMVPLDAVARDAGLAGSNDKYTMLITASKNDALVKASLLKTGQVTSALSATFLNDSVNGTRVSNIDAMGVVNANADFLARTGNAGIHREQEQCFVGHANAPYKFMIAANSLVGVSETEIINWQLKADYFEDVFYKQTLRQSVLPADRAISKVDTPAAMLDAMNGGADGAASRFREMTSLAGPSASSSTVASMAQRPPVPAEVPEVKKRTITNIEPHLQATSESPKQSQRTRSQTDPLKNEVLSSMSYNAGHLSDALNYKKGDTKGASDVSPGDAGGGGLSGLAPGEYGKAVAAGAMMTIEVDKEPASSSPTESMR